MPVAERSRTMEFDISSHNVSEFAETIKGTTALDVNVCYQCKKCTADCPVAYAMDYTPAQLMHAIRLGREDLVLNSATIWLCASCETCITRCPQDVTFTSIIQNAF